MISGIDEMNRIMKIGLLSLAIGLVLFVITGIILVEEHTTKIDYTEKIFVAYNGFNFTVVPLNTGDTISVKTNITQYLNHLIFYIAPQASPSDRINITTQVINGQNFTLNVDPGIYYLIVENHGNENITLWLNITVYKQVHKEILGRYSSLIGLLSMLFGLILTLKGKIDELSEKYPDYVKRRGIECWSTKLNKHKCTLYAPLLPIEFIKERIEPVLRQLGYKYRGRVGDNLVYERQYLNPFKVKSPKPSQIIIGYDEGKLTIYYEVLGPRAAGSMDLVWISDEAERILGALINHHSKE